MDRVIAEMGGSRQVTEWFAYLKLEEEMVQAMRLRAEVQAQTEAAARRKRPRRRAPGSE